MQAYPWPQLSAHVARKRGTLELPTRNTTKEKDQEHDEERTRRPARRNHLPTQPHEVVQATARGRVLAGRTPHRQNRVDAQARHRHGRQTRARNDAHGHSPQTVPSPLRREPVHPQGRVHGPVQRHLPARPVEAKHISPARSRPPSSGAYAYPRSTPLTPRPRASTHVDTNAPSVIHCMYQRQTPPRKESTPCRPPFFSTHP